MLYLGFAIYCTDFFFVYMCTIIFITIHCLVIYLFSLFVLVLLTIMPHTAPVIPLFLAKEYLEKNMVTFTLTYTPMGDLE